MNTPSTKRHYSKEEYLDYCEKSEERFEYVYGDIIELESDTLIGNRIAGNIHLFFGRHLREEAFIYFQSAVRVEVEEGQIFRIPDFVICDEKGDAVSYVTDPLLLVEVIDESTSNTDRSDKLFEYLKLKSLMYYLIIEQTRCFVEVFIREKDRWYVEFYAKLDDVVKLPYFNVELPVKTIYQKVNFHNAPSTKKR